MFLETSAKSGRNVEEAFISTAKKTHEEGLHRSTLTWQHEEGLHPHLAPAADRELVLAAVAQDGGALRYASAELQADREFMLTAVAQNGYALEYASAELRADREVVLAAVAQNGEALQYATSEQRTSIAPHRGTQGQQLCDLGAQQLASQLVADAGQSITWLDLRDNGLTCVPEAVCKLTQLETLKLGGNQLSELPLQLTALTQLKELDLSGMAALDRVTAIRKEKGVLGVFEFLRDLHDDPQPSHALKLVMAGPSMAGKTSLLNALRLGEARLTDALTGRTIGLDIKVLVLRDPRAPGGIRFLCYDAGGHDEYQEMHQMFLSPNTLYLLVWNVARVPVGDTAEARREHEKLTGWVNLIQTYCPGAKVLLVASHADELDAYAVEQRCEGMVGVVHRVLAKHRAAQQRELDTLRSLPETEAIAVRQRHLDAVLSHPLRLANEAVAVSAKELTGLDTLRQRMVNAAFDVDAFPTFGQNQPNTYTTILRELKLIHSSKSSVTWTQMQHSLRRLPDVDSATLNVTLTGSELTTSRAQEVAQLHAVLDMAKRAQWSTLRSSMFPVRGCNCTLPARLLNCVPPPRKFGVLHHLAHRGATEVYGELLQLGADFDVSLLSAEGQTVEAIAVARGHVAFAAMMKETGFTTPRRTAARESARLRQAMSTIGTLKYRIAHFISKDDFVEVRAELSSEGVLTLNGEHRTITVDLTQTGTVVREPKKSDSGRPFCLEVDQTGAEPMILDAVGAVEQRRWLDAAHRFAADDSAKHRVYTFSVEMCGMVVKEFTVRSRSVKAIHAELVDQGHCSGLTVPTKKNCGPELQNYYQQLFTCRETLALPLFRDRMGFDLEMLCERRCKVATKIRTDPDLLRRAMMYLRLKGEVLYYDQTALRDRVFLEPQRLVDIMKELMHHDLEQQLQLVSADTVRNAAIVKALGRNFIKLGVLEMKLLPWLWRNVEPTVADDPAQINFLVNLLSEAGLLTRVPEAASQQWLLPMRLPDRNEVLVTAAARNTFAMFIAEMDMDSAAVDASLVSATQTMCDAGVLARDDIQRGCHRALMKAEEVLGGAEYDEHGLSCDEIAAINFYTQNDMSSNGAQTNIFCPLNRAMRERNYAILRQCWRYIELLQRALLKLPHAPRDINIFRAISQPQPDLVLEDLLRKRDEKEPEVWWAFSSTSSDKSKAEHFLKPPGKRVLYTMEGSNARDVKRYSDYPGEEELLMPCGSSFVIVHAEASTNDEELLLVRLKQTGATLLDGVREEVREAHQHPALAALYHELEAAGAAVDFVGRRYEFHQPLPAGFLSIVISRCAKLCGEHTSVWRRDLITMMRVADERVEVSIGQQGASRVAFAARCRAGGHHARCLCKLQLLESEMLSVIKEQWVGCSATIV
eukprot:SAG25_NODE_396_length_8539_cov_5.889336_3_plen_1378_part_01